MSPKDEPEYGKIYALTGGYGVPCIANGNTWAESEVKEVPNSVKCSDFGCANCLWQSCECKNGSKYKPGGAGGCAAYTYYD